MRKAGSPSNSTPTDIDEEVDVKKAVDEAKDSDVVVLCLGEGSYTETPGNIHGFNFAGNAVEICRSRSLRPANLSFW